MKRFCTALIGVLTAAVYLGCLYANLLEYGGDWRTWVCFLVVSAVFFPFAAAVHELGHMLFGAAVKIEAVPKFGLSKTSYCEIVPKTDKNLRAGMIVTALGGVAVNLIFIILGVIAVFAPSVPASISMALPASFYFFALNVLPMTLESGKTDGLVAWEMIKYGDVAKVTLAVLTVQAQIASGKPIAEIDEKLLLEVPQISEDEPAFISLTELRAKYYEALGKVEKAENYMARFEQLRKDYIDG